MLLGTPADVQARAAGLGISLDGCAIRDPAGDAALAAYAGRLVANRERMTQSMAERTLRKPLYFGGAMLAAGDAAALGNPGDDRFAFGQPVSFSDSVSVVMPPDCESLKMPS